MRAVALSPKADADIDAFFLYLAKDSVDVANQFLARVEDTIKLIAEFPKLAPCYESTHPKLSSIRWFPVKSFPNHLIFYLEETDRITIVRLFHKAQNIASALE